MAAHMNRPNSLVMNIARAHVTTPATGHLINLADGGDVEAMRAALKFLAVAKVWQVYEIQKNSQLVCYIWGEDKVDAMTRWMPAALASEWSTGCEHTGPAEWSPSDQMTVQKAHIPTVLQSMSEAKGKAFVIMGWKAIMQARGKDVPNGFCHREFHQATYERLSDQSPSR